MKWKKRNVEMNHSLSFEHDQKNAIESLFNADVMKGNNLLFIVDFGILK